MADDDAAATDAETTDAELLRRHVAGDATAFGTLVSRHQDRLWAVALRTTGDREDAADALQNALVSAFRAAARFRGDAQVTTWLHRIVVNACLDRVRQRQSRLTVALDDDRAVPATRDEFAAADARLTVLEGLRRLSAEHRAALVLVDIEGHSVEEAAAILDVAVGTVKSRCARGRARLAALLTAADPGNESAASPVEDADRTGGEL